MNVTQQVPNFFGCISQAPDYDKPPGFLQDVKNAYPDYTYGLQKRQGSKFEFSLADTKGKTYTEEYLSGGRWFAQIINEIPFFGVLLPETDDREAKIHIWNAALRQECTVTGDFSYLTINDRSSVFPVTWEDIKQVSINQATVIINRKAQVKESTTKTPNGTVEEITIVAELPENADLNKIFHVLNSTHSEDDDYYTKWNGNAFEEVAAPNIPDGFDADTAPHVLVNTGILSFSFDPLDYEKRKVGNESTNQHPSFVGTYIENAFFYLNRVGFLSEDNVIMSQPLKADNYSGDLQSVDFYRISTLTQSPADPVDINVASVRPVTLASVQPAYQGLVVFAHGEQFMIYSDAGVITPQTAIAKSISTFELHDPVDAIEMGDEYYFISKTQRNTRVFKMITQGLERGPILIDVSKVINDYIPNNINALVPNSQNQFISLSSNEGRVMYIYRQTKENGEVLFNSWYTWELPGKIQTCVFTQDKMYTVTLNGNMGTVSSIPLNTVPEEDILTNVLNNDKNFFFPTVGVGPYLDLWIGGTNIQYTFDREYKRTEKDEDGNTVEVEMVEGINLTFANNFPTQIGYLKPVVVQSRDPLTRLVDVQAGHIMVQPEVKENSWFIPGKYRKDSVKNYVCGYRYEYDLKLPTYYMQTDNPDFSAHLNISRYKFIFKEAGLVEFKVQYFGRHDMRSEDNWHNLNPVTWANYYTADTTPIDGEVGFMLPIHQRNTSFRMRIFSDSPYPVTLNRMTWEGIYSPRYYRRA